MGEAQENQHSGDQNNHTGVDQFHKKPHHQLFMGVAWEEKVSGIFTEFKAGWRYDLHWCEYREDRWTRTHNLERGLVVLRAEDMPIAQAVRQTGP